MIKLMVSITITAIMALGIFLWAQQSKPKIKVSRQYALIDECIEISISNLAAQEVITIKASCQDKDHNTWVSQAIFEADDAGVVNLTKQAPISGTYKKVDSMGLFWSMAPIDRKIQHFSFDKNELEVCLSVFSHNELKGQKTILRLLVSPDVEKRKIREHGIVGTFFYPQNIKNAPGIIVVPGSSGGIPENKAQLLASHGYAVLALGYFGLDGLPKSLDNIRLEYFQNAMQWLKRQPEVNNRPIALLGSSRGGELVLLLAATFAQEINAVIACVPSSLVYSGFPQVDKPAWTYKNSPITFMPSPYFEDIANAVKEGFVADHKGTFEDPWEITPHFLYGMKKNHHAIEDATIPVENIRCPLLIISGEKDALWPSTLYGKLIMERLDKKQSMIQRKHLNFAHAGHAILFPYPPFMPVINDPIFIPEDKIWSQYGGTVEGNAHAAKESWHEVLNFLKTTLQ
jgi:dienelactone hydrolase